MQSGHAPVVEVRDPQVAVAARPSHLDVRRPRAERPLRPGLRVESCEPVRIRHVASEDLADPERAAAVREPAEEAAAALQGPRLLELERPRVDSYDVVPRS